MQRKGRRIKNRPVKSSQEPFKTWKSKSYLEKYGKKKSGWPVQGVGRVEIKENKNKNGMEEKWTAEK